jgi:dienelactone hydrolase
MKLTRREALLLPISAGLAFAKNAAPEGYTPMSLPQGGTEHHQTFVTAKMGPPVIVLHELPGLTPSDLDLGIRISKEGFTCYLPLIFGAPDTYSLYGNTLRACFGGQVSCSAAKGESHCITWLRLMRDEISKLHGSGPVGVIGMCLTGTFPLALLSENGPVKAAVLSQPALPQGLFASKSALGVSDDDVANARRSGVHMLGLRFETDTICPPEKFVTLSHAFPGQFEPYVIPPQPGEPARSAHMRHAVLTESYDPTMSGIRLAYDKVIALLHDKLDARAVPAA